MSISEAKEKGYTHHGKMYGIKIYLADNDDMDVVGTSWINDKILEMLIFVWLLITLGCLCALTGFFVAGMIICAIATIGGFLSLILSII